MIGRVTLACLALAACNEKPSQRGKLVVTYSVDLTRAIDDKVAAVQLDLEAALANKQLAAKVVTTPRGISVTPADVSTRPTIEQLVKATFGDVVEARPCDADVPSYAICIAIAPSYAHAVKQAALDQAIATVRARIGAMKVSDPNVVERGGQIVVELPATEDRASAIRNVLARTGKLELKVVDDGSAYMQRLYKHVYEAKDPEVTAEIDRWRSDSGAHITDYYVTAHDTEAVVTASEAKRFGCRIPSPPEGGVRCMLSGRVVLEGYLAKLAETDPTFRVPADRQIGFERLPEDFEAKARRPVWRTYYLERTPRLTGASIAEAKGTNDPVTNRPLVQVELDRRGAQTFGDLTAAIAGHKLAIVLDNRIQSAPVVMEAIRGGRLHITLGGNDPKAMKAERDELTNVLKTGALPAPLVEESLIEVP